MAILQTLLALLRRPWVLLVVLALSVGAGVLGWTMTPVKYESSATIVLTTPVRGASPFVSSRVESNPLLGFNDSLDRAVSLVVQSVNSPGVLKELEGGPTSGTKVAVSNGKYSARLQGAIGPFVLIEAVSTRSGRAAQEAVERGRLRVFDDLNNYERTLGAPEKTFIVPLDVMPTTTAQPIVKSKAVAAVGTAALGCVVALALVYASTRFRRPRETPSRPGPEPEPVDSTKLASPGQSAGASLA